MSQARDREKLAHSVHGKNLRHAMQCVATEININSANTWMKIWLGRQGVKMNWRNAFHVMAEGIIVMIVQVSSSFFPTITENAGRWIPSHSGMTKWNYNSFLLDEVEETTEPSCALSAWSEWSECSTRCGQGNQTRTRKYLQRNGKKYCEVIGQIKFGV